MSTFGGRVEELENVLIDNFLLYKHHTCFFLSHCHTDHMKGLYQLFSSINEESNNYIYCSSISSLVLMNKYGSVYRKVIKELTTSQEITIPGNDIAPSYQVTVTPIPAGHCPGSIMFLFETTKNTILYTGDFRLCKNDISRFKPLHSKTQVKVIDKVYLDSTFLSENYWEFPMRSQVVTELTNLIKNWIFRSPNHNVSLMTCAKYGYEYVFAELAKRLKCRIHINDKLYDLLYNVPEAGCFLTKDCRSTKVHAFGISDKKCLKIENKKLLRIKLSAQWYKSPKGVTHHKIWKKVSSRSILMCYSTHCSCSELVDFLTYLQPKSIKPCAIAVGSTEEDVSGLGQKRTYKLIEAVVTKAYIEQLSHSWNVQTGDDSEDIVKADFPLEKNHRFKLKFSERSATNLHDSLEFPL